MNKTHPATKAKMLRLTRERTECRKALRDISRVLTRKWPEHQDDGPREMLLYCINRARKAL